MVPLYPLYALLFVDAGMSERRISALFAIWALVAVVAEVPSGALADRVSRRGALVGSGLLQAAAYALWLAIPTFAGFAAGFVLWGVGGALVSGAFQALVHDGLAAHGSGHRLGAVLGRAEAATLLVQVPVAGAAVVLLQTGGFQLVGAVSVVTCLAAAAVALTLPDHRPDDDGDGDAPGPGYLTTVRSGVRIAVTAGGVRGMVAATGLIAAFEVVEEYTPMLAAGWGVPTAAIPVAVLAVPLAGALGAPLGGRLARAGRRRLGGWALGAATCLCAAVVVAHPAGIAAVAVFYGVWKAMSVAAEVRLQQAIDGPARATITSVAGLAAEVAAVPLLAVWALGGAGAVAPLALAAALVVPVLLGPPAPAGRRTESARERP
jgi:predicted MFS family arabinose efflux permease